MDGPSFAPERFDDRPQLLASDDRPSVVARPVLARLLTLAVLCLALLVAAGPVSSGARGPGPHPDPSPQGVATAILDGPPRGSLAADRSYVDALRTRSWSDGSASGESIPAPPVSSRRVVFVGDVPGGRWGLVAGRTADTLAAAWFTGPPGARPDQLVPQPIRRNFAVDGPVTLLDPLTGALVVVAAPGDEVTVSARPEIDADGHATRSYRRAPSSSGVAVVRLPRSDLPYTAAPLVRVLRNGSILLATHPELVDSSAAPPDIAVSFLRGIPSALGQQVTRAAAVDVVAQLGLRRDQMHVDALWTGEVPRVGTASGIAAIVAVTVPSGAVVVDAEWMAPEASGDYVLGSACGQAVEPAGIPVVRRVVAMACDVLVSTDDAPMRTSLVVVGPPEVSLVRAYSGDGALLAEEHAVDGVVVTPLPIGTDQVEAVTSGGVSLGRVALLDPKADVGG